MTRMMTLVAAAMLCVAACSKNKTNESSTPPPTPVPPMSELTADAGMPSPVADAGTLGETSAVPAVLEPGGGVAPVDVAQPVVRSQNRTTVATVLARSGSKLTGEVTLREIKEGVQVTLTLSGATVGKKAVHFHERADCSAADAKSAGEHWNPTGAAHGLPVASEHHLGDLGNVEVTAGGTGVLTIVVNGVNLEPGGQRSLVGRALVVHADPDDGKSQPSGAAGDRIGCAEIR